MSPNPKLRSVWMWMCEFKTSPLSNCLISLLACVVVNWLTMSKAVWLRVFLTPALMPLYNETEEINKGQSWNTDQYEGWCGYSMRLARLSVYATCSRNVFIFFTAQCKEWWTMRCKFAWLKKTHLRTKYLHLAAAAPPPSSHRGQPDAGQCHTQTVCWCLSQPGSTTCRATST